MTLLQMQYFMEVCRCGSTLKAAQAANVSQSTISMAIRALEKELSIPLFDRSSKGLAPTAAGSFFLDQCSGILKKTERLAEEMKQFLSISRPLRLGIPVVLNEFYWLDLYFELKKQLPDLEFQTTNRTVPLLLSMLRDSSLDAVLAMRDTPDPDLRSLKLHTSRHRYVTMSRRHPLAEKGQVSYEDLITCPVIGYAGDDLNTQLLKYVYKKRGKEFSYAFHVDQFSSLLRLLKRNAGIAFLNKKLPSSDPELVSLPIREEQGNFTIWLLWTPESPLERMPQSFFRVWTHFFEEIQD